MLQMVPIQLWAAHRAGIPVYMHVQNYQLVNHLKYVP